MLSPFRMVSRNFILPESANYVFFYAFSFLRNLLYLINEYWGDLEKIFRNLRDKLITQSDIDFDAEFDEMVQTWKKNGGDLVTESMNAVYQGK